MSTRLHGKNGQIVVNGTTWTTKTNWQISVNRDFADVSVYGDGGKVYYAGLRDVTGTYAGLWDGDGESASAAAYLDLVTIALYADGSHLVASGSGYVTVQVDTNAADAVRVSGTFRGSGVWSLH